MRKLLLASVAVLSLGAAIFGAYRAVQAVVKVPPAVAMQPPAPARFRHSLPDR